MLDRFSRVLFTAVLLFMAVYLAWYGYCRKQVAAGNLEFQAESSFAEFFPQPLQLRGNLAYYGEMDPVMAAEYFREAIAVQPITIDAWLSLAQMELAMGRMDEARRLLGIVSPLIPHVSTWKWKQFALAGETRDEELFIHCYNFILSRLPARVGEASFLAATYWGGWDRVLPHVAPENHTVFLEQLMRYGQLDVALDLWRIIQEREAQSRLYVEQGAAGSVAQASSAGTNRPANPSSSGNASSAEEPPPGIPDEQLKLRFCSALLADGRISEAKRVWKGIVDEENPVHDGGFESEPLNMAFGWRFARSTEVSISRSKEMPVAGDYALKLRFNGTKNVVFGHVSQVVPVEPGQSYILSFFQRSREITTDQGVFIRVSGFQCEGLQAETQPVTGTIPWTQEDLLVEVPEGCEAMLLQVRRKESLKLNNKIAGDFWLDFFRLNPVAKSPTGDGYIGGR